MTAVTGYFYVNPKTDTDKLEEVGPAFFRIYNALYGEDFLGATVKEARTMEIQNGYDPDECELYEVSIRKVGTTV